jgi:hypothetical protein
MSDSQAETQQSQRNDQYRLLPPGKRPIRCLPRQRASSDRPDVPPDPDGSPGPKPADASGICPDCNDIEIDDIGIWVLVECSPGQCVYALTAASRSMFDDDWKLRL